MCFRKEIIKRLEKPPDVLSTEGRGNFGGFTRFFAVAAPKKN
jgi:hypothetical protein